MAAVGDDEPVAMLARPSADEARAEPDTRQVIRLWTAYGLANCCIAPSGG